MFSRIIKDISLKKNINKRLIKLTDASNDKINTIGIIIDSTYFFDSEKLLTEIKSRKNDFKDIQILYYNDKIGHKNSLSHLSFSHKDISLSGEINVVEVKDFISYPFDLLINFYDEEKLPLKFVSLSSKAKFKVGFSSNKSVGNHLLIKSEVKNYPEFISEMFKYLKILNKI
ncbi:conserved hypothetical protein [Flavobacterium sp. 9AF]|uniref:DUF6913 domain-containing protein n=1 Tax=Flavobacterium sp. 9AF TaxID=2653142 RepID=UPI0012EF6BB1|nr:hypothetical protein [Flavobacterium sp. 9AF]VXC22052.1 conserved hypothetical protein [Flavobacterium sp. 9AF]